MLRSLKLVQNRKLSKVCAHGESTGATSIALCGHVLRILVVACMCATSLIGRAQSAGANLSGQVLDPSGAIVSTATLTITNVADGAVHATKSNDRGVYSISDLPPGTYTVSIAATGFSSQIVKNLELTVGGSRQLDLKLAVGDVSQTVEVTAAAVDVEADTSVVSATVGQKRIVDLPLNGRDWTQLATLQPGVTNVRSQQTGGVSIGGNRGIRGFGAQLTTNGHSPYENTYRINGINENDFSNGAPGSPIGVNLGVDAIQEFSVVTSAYTAEYGRVSGAVVNAVTRSGTNDIHGTAFIFDRDKIFDARNFFDGVNIPPFHRVQFGAAAGGPIKKNKTFLFGNYEGIRQSQSTAYNSLVPSAAARAGNIHSANGTPITVTVDPNVAPYFRLYPLPNAGLNAGTFGDTGTYAASNPSGARETFFTTRFDQTFSEKDNLAVSYLYDDGHQTAPDPLGNILSDLLSGRQVATITENHTFGSSLLNVFRMGYNRSHVRVFDPIRASNPAAADTSLGFFPGLYTPQLTITGLTAAYGLGGPRRVEGSLNSYQLYDDVVFTKGRHTLKLGFAFEQLRNFNHSLPQLGGVTFLSLAGFLQNQPYTAQVPTLQTTPVEPTSNIIAEYLQDDWRVSHNLTVNLGIRYEILTIPYDRKNRLGFINTINAPAGSGPCPLVVAPTNIPGCTVPASKFFQSNPTLHNAEPRVGFSYDPFGSGKTAVRGAFGIYDQLPLPVFYATYSGLTAPYDLDQLIVGTLPVGSFPNGIPPLAASSAANRLGHYVDPNPKRDYSMNYNFNIEQLYGKYVSTSIGYSGEHSIHGIFNAQDLNQVAPPNVQVIQGRYVWPIGGVQPDANTRAIYGFFFDNSSHYNGLLTQIKVNGYHGANLQGTYTWGQCVDYGSSTQSPTTYQNTLPGLIYFDKQMRKGRCDYSITQNFTANGLYEIPAHFNSEVLTAVASGWQIGGIVFASTGVPFTLINPGDVLGQKGTSLAPLPDFIAGCNPYNTNYKTGSHYYVNTTCFAYPTVAAGSQIAPLCNQAGTTPTNGGVLCLNVEGNLRRNSLIGPRQVEADLSLIKNTSLRRLSETANLQLRFEAFNVLNHTNFQAPTDFITFGARSGFNTVNQGTAGILDSTATTARQIQIGAKVSF